MGVNEVPNDIPGMQLGSLGTLVQVHCAKPFAMLVYFEVGDPRGWKPGPLEITSPLRYRFDGQSSICVSGSELPPLLALPPRQTTIDMELTMVEGTAAPAPELVTRGFVREVTIEFESDMPLVGFAGATILGKCGRDLDSVSVVADFRIDESVMLRDLEKICTSSAPR
ncbi:MAG: hypothetical protein ACI9OJ_002405 [Myxococcota bacterium]|jgi:hypothetical protein